MNDESPDFMESGLSICSCIFETGVNDEGIDVMVLADTNHLSLISSSLLMNPAKESAR